MKKKRFHLGDILSISTERTVSPRGFDGLLDIFDHLTGHCDNWRNSQKSNWCKSHLLKQFPQLGSPEMKKAVDELQNLLMLKTVEAESKESLEERNAVYDKIVKEWLAKQVAKYGEYFDVMKPSSLDESCTS